MESRKRIHINIPTDQDEQTTSNLWLTLKGPTHFNWKMQGASWITETQSYYCLGRDGSLIFFQIGYSNLAWPSNTCQVSARYFRPPPTNTFVKNGEGRAKEHWRQPMNVFETQTYSSMRMVMSDDWSGVTIANTSIKHLRDPETNELVLMQVEFGDSEQLKFNLGMTTDVQPMQLGPDGAVHFILTIDNDNEDAKDEKLPQTSDEFVRTQFVPSAHVAGSFKAGEMTREWPFEGRALVIHQFMGFKPHLCTTRWHLCYFVADTEHSGMPTTTLLQIQFQTNEQYGNGTVNRGIVVIKGEPLGCSFANRLVELDSEICSESARSIPARIQYNWKGIDMHGDSYTASCIANLDNRCACISLLDSIPSVLRAVVECFMEKPYVHQWLDRATVNLRTSSGEQSLEGWMFQEIASVQS